MTCRLTKSMESIGAIVKKMNFLMFIPLILNPWFKLDFAQFVIVEMFKSQGNRGLAMSSKLEKTLIVLFNVQGDI